MATLRELMGEDRAEFTRRDSSLYEKQQQQAYMGQDFTKTEIGMFCQRKTFRQIYEENFLSDILTVTEC